MQLWIFFEPGAGGDGFSNLLEQSDQCVPLDLKKIIRLDRYVDFIPKFWMPTVDQHGCFRTNRPFRQLDNQLSDTYTDFVVNNRSGFVIVPSHDVKLHLLNSSDSADLFTKNQIKVRLHRRDIPSQVFHAHKSNLIEYNDAQIKKSIDLCTANKLKLPHYDIEYCIDDLWDSWSLFQQFCRELKITIDQRFYDLFCSIKNQEFYCVTPGIDYFESYVENAVVKYRTVLSEMATKNCSTASLYYGFTD